MSFVAPLVREALRYGIRHSSKFVKRYINIQDDLVKSAWMTSPTRNIVGRGGVLGARHGAAGGAVIGGILNLGLDHTNPGGFSKRPVRPTSHKFSKKYSTKRRYNRRCRPRYYGPRRY